MIRGYVIYWIFICKFKMLFVDCCVVCFLFLFLCFIIFCRMIFCNLLGLCSWSFIFFLWFKVIFYWFYLIEFLFFDRMGFVCDFFCWKCIVFLKFEGVSYLILRFEYFSIIEVSLKGGYCMCICDFLIFVNVFKLLSLL